MVQQQLGLGFRQLVMVMGQQLVMGILEQLVMVMGQQLVMG
jgi:hypothetical protein